MAAPTPLQRQAVCAALVLAGAVGSFLVARGTRKPYSPDAPEHRRLGPADAKISIVEFSDFECPACRYAEVPLKQILELHKGKVRFTFKHFPLERMHHYARPAAIASECAGRQGKFWELHDLFYDDQNAWPNDGFEKQLAGYAKKIKLDAKAFAACRADASVDAVVTGDAKDGDNAWVGSTPTFFINGRRFVGGKQLAERGSSFIEKELKK